MSKSKTNKSHKQRLQKRKNKIKQMSENLQNGQAQVPQMPAIRNVPTWDKEADIIVKGYEWEVIYNTIASLQILFQATSAVMSRNVVSGAISMDFQKLDPATLQYVAMTPEEKAPQIEEFKKILEQMRAPQEMAVPSVETQSDSNPIEEGKVVTMPKRVRKQKEEVAPEVSN